MFTLGKREVFGKLSADFIYLRSGSLLTQIVLQYMLEQDNVVDFNGEIGVLQNMFMLI